MWPTSLDTLLYVSPDELRGAGWILASYPFELGGLPVASQLSVRPHADAALTEWNAYFTAGVPPEALADLLLALDAREAPDTGFADHESVLTALSARGWLRDMDRPRTTATDPGFSGHVSLETLPPPIHDADPRDDLLGWQAWAEPALAPPPCGVPASARAFRTTSSPPSPPRGPPRSRYHGALCRRVRRVGSPSSGAADALPGPTRPVSHARLLPASGRRRTSLCPTASWATSLVHLQEVCSSLPLIRLAIARRTAPPTMLAERRGLTVMRAGRRGRRGRGPGRGSRPARARASSTTC